MIAYYAAPAVAIIAVLHLLAPLGAFAEVRTFTSPDGRTVDAEIVSATPDQVTLKLASGQSLVAVIDRFSDADKQFIAEWRKQNPVPIKYSFTANFAKEKTGSSESLSNHVLTKTESWICKMKIANRSGQPLEDVAVQYDLFYSEANGKASVIHKESGIAKIDQIKHLEEKMAPTKEFKLSSSAMQDGYIWKDGSPTRDRDSFLGMVITLNHAGKEVFRWVSSGVPKDRAVATGSSGGGSVFDK